MNRILLALLVFAAAAGRGLCGAAGHAPEKTEAMPDMLFAPADLRADVEALSGALQRVHPAFFKAEGKFAELPKVLEEFKQTLRKPLTQGEFYIRLAPLLAGLDDGHTGIGIPGEYLDAYGDAGGRVFPFDVVQIDGAMRVMRNYSSQTNIAPGARIVSINGVPADEVVRGVIQHLPGERVERRLHGLESSSDLLKVMMWLDRGFGDSFRIRFELGGAESEAMVPGVTRDHLRGSRSALQLREDLLHYERLDTNTALLRVRTFDSPARERKRFFDDAFRRLREDNIQRLIIDLRNNGGGSSKMARELFARIARERFAILPSYEVRASAEVKRNFRNQRPKATRWLPAQLAGGFTRRLWRAPDGGMVTMKEGPEDPNPARDRYTGRLCVLINEGTFSMASIFAAWVKEHKLGPLVGRETGGLAHETSGHALNMPLPHSGLMFICASMRFQFDPQGTPSNGRGVTPDVVVEKNLEDVLAGRDTTLEEARKLLESVDSPATGISISE